MSSVWNGLAVVLEHFIEVKIVESAEVFVGNMFGVNPRREGLVSLTVERMPSQEVVARLLEEGIRVHVRKDDHYSGNILKPLGLDSCVRVSMCHYNTREEVARFLTAMRAILET